MDEVRRRLLEQFGYTLTFRRHGWAECLLLHAGERWFGSGSDESEALEHALAQALPSALARELFAAAMGSAVLNGATAEPVGASSVASAAESTTAVRGGFVEAAKVAPLPALPPSGRDTTPGAEQVSAPQLPNPLSAAIQGAAALAVDVPPEPAAADLASEPCAVPLLADVPDLADPGTPAALGPQPNSAATPPAVPNANHWLSPREAHDELTALEHAIRINYDEASLLAPARQRLLLTQWMARGRSVQDACPGDASVEHRVYELSQWIGKLAKVWWPGSIRVLMKWHQPEDCRQDVEADPDTELHRWRDVELAAAVALERLEEADQDAGFDELGWADALALRPAHEEPVKALQAVRERIERFTLPRLTRPADAAHASSLAPSLQGQAIGDPSTWIDLARTLRWLRGCVDDAEMWGAAMGRLRWLVSLRDAPADLRSLQRTLLGILDPAHRPASNWQRELRVLERRRLQQRKELLAKKPLPAWSDSVLRAWIDSAMALGEAMPSSELACLLEPVGERVLAMDSQSLAERRQRRRLAAVQQLLRKAGVRAPAVAVSADAADADRAAEAHTETRARELTGHATAEVASAEATAAEARPTTAAASEAWRSTEDQLATHLRPRTAGRRVLFVSNRHDPARDERLRELLGFASLDPCVCESSRIDAKTRSIRQGGYDLVLAATGFLPHKVDGALKDACRLQGVPYVRVNRGRPLQCLRRLTQDLGLARTDAA